MDNELMHYATGSVLPQRSDKAVARRSKTIYDDVRVVGFMEDGLFALAEHAMHGMTRLDATRQMLRSNDRLHNEVLAEIEVGALRAISRIQCSLLDQWGL